MAKKDPKQNRPVRTEPLTAVTTDPRFTNIHTDPRFRLPKKRDRTITVDSRFKKVLTDDDFAQKALVDKYGRKLPVDKRREEIKRFYTFEDDDKGEDEEDDDDNDEEDDDEGIIANRVAEKTKASTVDLAPPSDSDEEEDEEDAPAVYDPARGEGIIDTDSSSDSSDEDDEVIESEAEELSQAQQEADEIPLGDVTSRIAVVNLDWDYVKSVDLMVILNSFVPIGGKITRISIYPSEFGKERMEREEMEGPPKELFNTIASAKKVVKQVTRDDDGTGDNQEEITEQTYVKEDTGEEFDSASLRKYQLERLRYFYAVVECDSPPTANAIYTECDGAEFGTTANFFDLRFVPDGTTFDDRPRDECTGLPKKYTPTEFTTDALQHSKVKLTWDQEDQTRKQAAKEAFSRKDIDDMDLKAYLASDSEDENEEAREAIRKLLDLPTAGEGSKKSKEKKPVGDMEVTFSAALTEDDKNGEIFEKEETTLEKYARKEKERKKKRKEKMKEKRGGDDEAEDAEMAEDGNTPAEPRKDLGFDDPFFEDGEKVNKDNKKADKQKRREEKQREAEKQASQREELELLMMDDADTVSTVKPQHFNMQNIVKKEKLAKLKGKAAKRLVKKGVADAEGLQDSYNLDVRDPRFSAIYEKSEFAIDPTNPRYKKTEAMGQVMEERRKRRLKDTDGIPAEDGKSSKKKRNT